MVDGYTIVYTDGSCQGDGQEGCKAGLGVFWGNGNHLNKGRMVEGIAQTNNIRVMTVNTR